MGSQRRRSGGRQAPRAPARRSAPGRSGTSSSRLRPLRRAGFGPRLARLPRIAWALVLVVLLVALNYAIQVFRKPTELLGLVASPAPLGADETWARYGPDVREKSTELVRPELLAALIQLESAGDPLARTYWKWRWTVDPSRVYAPASSAVGLLQLTDGAFAEAQHYCVRDHRVLRDDGPLLERCWWSSLYFRTKPRHAIELTAALLDVKVRDAIGGARAAALPPARRDALAAAIHLCGPGRAQAFAAAGFRARPGERCGDHDLGGYLERVRALTARFERLEREGGEGR